MLRQDWWVTRSGLLGLVVIGHLFAGRAVAQNFDSPISLESRWWNEHEFAWRLSDAARLRWAIVDGISARGRAGGDNVPASEIARGFEASTGIRLELIGGTVVAHRPNDTERQALEQKLRSGGPAAVQAAWKLGWLKDARAWPALAQAVASKDPAVALAAANALRRLDGEEDFDIRRWIPSGRERQGDLFYSDESPLDAGLSQLPLGACFPDVLSPAELQTLAASDYVPLREAAARIAAGNKQGKALVAKLAEDPSLDVRRAAERSDRAWAALPDFKPRPVLKPDLTKYREQAANKDYKSNGPLPWLAAFGTDQDLEMIVGLLDFSGEVKPRGAMETVLHKAGGPAVADRFREIAAEGRPWPSTNQVYKGHTPYIGMAKYVLAMLFDGERLAEEIGPRLGFEHWTVSSELLLARLAGPPALPHLERVLLLRGHIAPVAIGYIGGPDGVAMIGPLLNEEDLRVSTAAARGLGESGQLAAVKPLIAALDGPNRVLRSRAALALGRIGGPEAAEALAKLIRREKQYLPRSSACAMLREIANGKPQYLTLVAATEQELAEFVPSYDPVNSRFDASFPKGELVPLGPLFTVVAVGELRCAVDQHAGVWMFYGGCSGGYNNQAVGYDIASGEWFLIRPNEMTGLFYNEMRPGAGCSRGMAYDPKSRQIWLNNATGAPVQPNSSNWAMSIKSGYYDLALDRFEGPWPDPTLDSDDRRSGTYYVVDSKRGHVYSEVMTAKSQFWTIDTASRRLIPRDFTGAPGGLAAFYVHEAAGYDPVTDQLFREIRGKNKLKRGQTPEEEFGVWMFDLASGMVQKSRSPIPSEGESSQGNMIFDSLNRELLLLRKNGAWVYDRENDDWQQASQRDCSFYVAAYDPQHNVVIGNIGSRLMAFRLKDVPVGTKAFFGEAGEQ